MFKMCSYSCEKSYTIKIQTCLTSIKENNYLLNILINSETVLVVSFSPLQQ